jgi:hypothetical protein
MRIKLRGILLTHHPVGRIGKLFILVWGSSVVIWGTQPLLLAMHVVARPFAKAALKHGAAYDSIYVYCEVLGWECSSGNVILI